MPAVEEEKAVQGATMEITVSRQDLLRELTATQSVVERKTTIPILSNFLLEADGDRIVITATDLDQSIRTSCAAKVKKPGSCTIPARKLYDYIRLLGDGDMSVKLLENHWVQIRSGRSNTRWWAWPARTSRRCLTSPKAALRASPSLRCAPSSRAPSSPSPTRNPATPSTARCSSSRPNPSPWSPPTAIASPTSRKTGETFSGITAEKKTLIPRKALQELQSLLSNTEAEHVEFADDDSTLFFRIGHRVLTSRKLTGQFPNYEAVMPRDNNKFVIVRSTDLFASIQRVAQFADERSGAIKMRIEQNELKVSSSSTEAGESEDTIETPYTFDAIVVGFNSSYLIDFLKAIGNEGEVRLEFKDAQSAGQMRPEDGSDEYKYRYIIMPMRI